MTFKEGLKFGAGFAIGETLSMAVANVVCERILKAIKTDEKTEETETVEEDS